MKALREYRRTKSGENSDNEEYMDMIFKKSLKKDSYFKHNQDYQQAKSWLDKYWSNQKLLVKLQQDLQMKPISCIKYNYSLERDVQDFDSQEAQIKISMDGEELEIHNMKIHEQREYVLEADPNEVKRLTQDAGNREERYV